MANVKLENKWNDGFYQLETTDPVMGGEDGIDNLQTKQLGANIFFIRGKGIAEWINNITYAKHSLVNVEGELYISLVDNNKNIQVNDATKWAKLIQAASTTIAGIVKLNNTTTSTSTTEAATANAVKSAMDKANTATTAAGTAQTAANNAQTAATNANTNANGRVPSSLKVNNKALNADITLSASDVGALPYYGSLANNIDINTLDGNKFGIYYQPVDAGATILLNYPTTNAGSLIVLKNAHAGTGAYCTQIYSPFNTNVIYVRKYNETSKKWLSWVSLISSTDLATTGGYGITKLSSAINNAAEDLAATAGAVKKAYDLARTANTAAGTAQSTASTATTTANTAKTTADTAKTAAANAQATANNAQTAANNANNNANNRVPVSRKVNNKALNADITLTADDVNAVPATKKGSTYEVGAQTNFTKVPTFLGKKLTSISDFKSSIDSSGGYIELPNGIIIQLLNGAAEHWDTVVNFKKPFPNACIAATISIDGKSQNPHEYCLYLKGTTKSGTTIHTNGIGTSKFSIIAIGF